MNTRVLGYWQPNADLSDELDANQERVAIQLQQHVITLGLSFRLGSVHTPTTMAQWLEPGNNAFNWHKDEGQFIVWSNVQPTDFLFHNGMMLPARNTAVILVDNDEGLHRTPQPVHPSRWLVRLD